MTPSPEPLFRLQALAQHRAGARGQALAQAPVSAGLLAWFLVLVAVALITFLCCFDYARRVRASGRLLALEGVVRVLPAAEGIVMRRFIQDGQLVSAGQALFAISVERKSQEVGDVADAVLREIRHRARTLEQDGQSLLTQRTRDRGALQSKLGLLRRQLDEVGREIELQQRAARVGEEYLQRYRQLASQRFVSEAALQEKEQAQIQTMVRMHALQRDRSLIEQGLSEAQAALDNFSLKVDGELNALRRQASSTQQDAVETQLRRELIVYAAVEGQVTGVLVEAGQAVRTGQVMASIIPQGTRLYLQLNIPSSAAGFVSAGQEVQIRYASFPFQRFGQYGGRVQSIAASALTGAELRTGESAGEFFYPARVALDSQEVLGEGRRLPLREGMVADADLLLERRPLIHWLLEPLLATRQRYASG